MRYVPRQLESAVVAASCTCRPAAWQEFAAEHLP
jgi:hypothetical protein